MQPPPTKTRKSTPRTRTGCQSCRTRRIRCDERRPACQNCLRSGWSCPGYPSTPTSLARTPSPTAAHTVTVYHLPPNILGTQADRHALHYFAVVAAADIGGYSAADFWTRAILQRSRHDAPVRHAVAALVRVHREYVGCDVSAGFAEGGEVVAAYMRAMKALRRYLRRDRGGAVDRRVVMMCCAAFFCFELIRGEQGAALRHLSSGVEVLRQWQMERPVSWPAVREGERAQLADVFSRMDLQASAFDDGVTLTSRKSRMGSDVLGHRLSDPSACSGPGLHAAKYSMLLRRCFNFLVDSAPRRRGCLAYIHIEALRTRDGLLKELEAWEEHLMDLKTGETNADFPVQLDRAIARSNFHCSMIRVLIRHRLPTSPDQPPGVRLSLDDKADDLLHLASEAIGANSEQDRVGDAPAGRHFCLHLGIVAPLFLLALKTCRPDVRAACLALLGRCKGRREGLYDADVLAQIIEVVMRRNDEKSTGSLLDRMGAAAVSRLQEAVESVVPAKDDGARRMKGLCRLLAIVG